MIPIPTLSLNRSWYAENIAEFHATSDDQVLARLVRESAFSVLQSQRDAWLAQLPILRGALVGHVGRLFLEFSIPRMGRRVDAVVLIKGLVLAIEFKIGAKEYTQCDIDQSYDYAMDLKYFHEASHNVPVVPVLVASHAPYKPVVLTPHPRISGLYATVCTNSDRLASSIEGLLAEFPAERIDPHLWETSRYCPTPTIVEAARALYAGHRVENISRNEAGTVNLLDTSDQVSMIIDKSKSSGEKAICFVTGVPGAGKTLVGLNIATKYSNPESDLHSVFLSGNGPLVAILREALSRDLIERERAQDNRLKKNDALVRVKALIQNVHHFRDECLRDRSRPPVDHVAIFDEAQRAWDLEQTSSFMRRKKGVSGFNISEPEFLISCMDRRVDWAVIVCLVGGGQEINTGEAGIGEWIRVVRKREFSDWQVYISPELTDSEYAAGSILEALQDRPGVHYCQNLHLGVSMRSFRAEKVSQFIKTLLDCDTTTAKILFHQIEDRYPIALTRNLEVAKQWLRGHASGTERFGIIVSSKAERLKTYAIDVRTPVNPVNWFLDGKDDVRSSYYLEDVATEFHVQGLELDWVCVSWDGDFRYNEGSWGHFSFRGTKWQRIKKEPRTTFLKNAYRVLLTRARQGMVIFVPEGSLTDPTRDPSFYDSTFEYLLSLGLHAI